MRHADVDRVRDLEVELHLPLVVAQSDPGGAARRVGRRQLDDDRFGHVRAIGQRDSQVHPDEPVTDPLRRDDVDDGSEDLGHPLGRHVGMVHHAGR
jgi:hypothetical protein